MKKYFLQLIIASFLSLNAYSSLQAQETKFSLPTWIEKAVFYQIYPQSFQDTNGDGIGDIQGVINRLDYVKSIGCNTVWLNPCFHSAFMDAGYDIIDFYRVAPRYGTNDDLRRLFEEAHQRNMRVILDLVAGHSSDQSPWFKYSQRKEQNPYSNRYIWTNDSTIRPEKFVAGKFERNGTYRKNYFDCQPALNYGYGEPDPAHPWEEPITAPGPTAMRQELIHIMDYWMQMGCDGFRVDMAGSLVKNDPQLVGTTELWHEVRQHFQSLYPDGILLAEWGNPQKAIKVGFMMDFIIHFGNTGYDRMMFNQVGTSRRDTCYFDLKGVGNPDPFINNLYDCLKVIGDKGHICIPTANHDFQRANCGPRNTPEQLKASLAFFLTLPGVPLIYYGDEIGMKFIDGLPNKEGSMLSKGNRAGSRTPMQWDSSPGAGFSTASIKQYYLPIDTCANRPNVEQEEKDSLSLLNYVRRLLELRKEHPALACRGEIQFWQEGSDKYPLVYERKEGSERILICINPSGRTVKTERSYTRSFRKLTPLLTTGGNTEQRIKLKGKKLQLSVPPLSIGIYKIQ
jgi:maltose alpha-D-glucosyltransferase / alpha-amylase